MATDITQRKVTVKLPDQATTAQGDATNVAGNLRAAVNQPTLPQGTTVNPALQNVQAGETVSTAGVTGATTFCRSFRNGGGIAEHNTFNQDSLRRLCRHTSNSLSK